MHKRRFCLVLFTWVPGCVNWASGTGNGCSFACGPQLRVSLLSVHTFSLLLGGRVGFTVRTPRAQTQLSWRPKSWGPVRSECSSPFSCYFSCLIFKKLLFHFWLNIVFYFKDKQPLNHHYQAGLFFSRYCSSKVFLSRNWLVLVTEVHDFKWIFPPTKYGRWVINLSSPYRRVIVSWNL